MILIKAVKSQEEITEVYQIVILQKNQGYTVTLSLQMTDAGRE
jgi:hypothetical protein